MLLVGPVVCLPNCLLKMLWAFSRVVGTDIFALTHTWTRWNIDSLGEHASSTLHTHPHPVPSPNQCTLPASHLPFQALLQPQQISSPALSCGLCLWPSSSSDVLSSFRFGKPDASQGATVVSEPRAHLPADLTCVCLLPEPTDPTLCHQSLTQSDPYTEDPVSNQRGRWPRHSLSYNHVQ